MSATTAPGTVRYSAWMDSESVTLLRDVYAGVCGPMQSAPADRFPTLDDVAAWITEQGFELASGWRYERNYNGLLLTADLTRS